ncbi:MAG TPA: HAMP domain-containing sensor histidine kinase [Solirubrobacteraceae bacterium]|jgi:signal transduction histidine kinase|nr:HAMP domain-containing sensor histidine kinase [Solirubrobacteraceae bacterium]
MAATLPAQSDLARAPGGAPGPAGITRPEFARSPDADVARTRNAALALGAFVLLYLSWQLTGWIPGSKENVGDLLILPIDAAAVYAAWSASRRCIGSSRLRSFWRLMAFALAAEALGDVIQAIYDIGLHHSPYPSLADPFYLVFYPLLLLALLTVTTRTKLLKPTLDGATIVVGGGAVVWYLVLGPTVEQSQSPLTMGVSMAFPLGDLFLLAGLAAMLLRPGPIAFRAPLKLITAAVLLGIGADVLYGYGQLHGTYRAGDWIDTLYVLEFATFALAGFSQRSVRHGDPDAEVEDTAQSRSRASWLPYLSLAIGLGVLLGVEWGTRFFPTVSLVLIVIVLAVLVAARQYVAQRELVQAQAALRESERMKDEFLSTVGHELRTPLTSIRGSLGLLEAGVLGELPADATNMVSVAVLNADRLVRLIGDILDIERMAAGGLLLEPVAVDATELVSQSLQVLQANANAAGVTLCEDVAPIRVMADADRIVQVLVNLLGNAVKFSPPGGVVTVTVERKNRCAIFSVWDTGRGIPADRLEKIFERFRQVDASDAREKGGTGLGLPIARGIVERHGGRVWAESRVGVGSTFRFTLPVAVADLEPVRSGVA